MTSFLSSISSNFSKSLILGTFSPVAVFTVLAMIFVFPLFPADVPFVNQFVMLDPAWQVVAGTLATIILTLLLYNLSTPIIRLYEGYPWQDSWLGVWWSAKYRRQFDADKELGTRMVELLDAVDENAAKRGELRVECGKVLLRLNRKWPERRDLILPTALGNIMRSFVDYSRKEYGIEAVELWPRLSPQVDPAYATAIDDAQVSFIFTLNCSVLSGLLGMSMLTLGLWYPAVVVAPSLWITWLIETFVFLALAWIFYKLSISRAEEWGRVVKGVFDLYRNDLLAKLGYTQTPSTKQQERDLWLGISRQMVFGDKPVGRAGYPRVNYTDAQPSAPVNARAMPSGVQLEIARGISQGSGMGMKTIVICVRNVDEHHAAKNIVITDTLPSELCYVWDSAVACGRSIHVTGTNPYLFAVGDLDRAEEVKLSYQAMALQDDVVVRVADTH